MTIAICDTEEYATRRFKSVCRMHISLIIRPPIVENAITRLLILIKSFTQKFMHRIKPYPPSFNKIPARIIDPARGASTWALGNHRCKKKIGNFTMNTKDTYNHQILLNVLFLE